MLPAPNPQPSTVGVLEAGTRFAPRRSLYARGRIIKGSSTHNVVHLWARRIETATVGVHALAYLRRPPPDSLKAELQHRPPNTGQPNPMSLEPTAGSPPCTDSPQTASTDGNGHTQTRTSSEIGIRNAESIAIIPHSAFRTP